MKLLKNKIEIRNLSLSDNLEQVAELIYKTDPYIYPYWFKKFKDWKSVLVEQIKQEGSLFNFKNIIVALNENNVVGILVALNTQTDLSFDYNVLTKVNKNFSYTIKKYLNNIKDYIQDNTIYIPNICVDEKFRKQKVATNLIKFVKKKNPNKSLSLHCLSNNAPAVNLYLKSNFKIVGKQKGFNAPLKLKPKIYEMKFNKIKKNSL